MLRLSPKTYLMLEFGVLYAGVPLLIAFFRSRLLLIAVLWVGALLACRWLKARGAVSFRGEGFRLGLKAVVMRFALIAPLIFLLAWFFLPQDFLSFPRTKPAFWLAVMLLYPVLSALPQEILYRAFLFERYAPLWGRTKGYIAASALVFGFGHIIMLNGIAVVMSALGGLIFARDYVRNKSLGLVCLEHALYGAVIFTAGLGRLFFTGAAWR